MISKLVLFSFLIYTPFLGIFSQESREQVLSHLLPSDHPIKPWLDKTFKKSRVTFNLESLREAGFKKSKPRKFTHLVVTKHPDLPGYIFKLYLDIQNYHKEKPEHYYWLLRIQGVEKVRQIIEENGWGVFFKTPKKWIYQLPKFPKPLSGYPAKEYILVEEDMQLLSDQENNALWASEYVTEEILDKFYAIISQAGLADAAKPDNSAFSIDGRIAFIDTQTFGCKSVKYKKLIPYLSKKNQSYWKELIKASN